MKKIFGRILLAGVLGGVALGATIYHVMQVYLAECDKGDPVRAEASPEEPSSAEEAEDAAEDAAVDAAAEAAENAAADAAAEGPAPEDDPGNEAAE